MLFKLVIALTFMVVTVSSQNYIQQARLYSGVSGTGSSLLLNQQYSNDLSQHGFNKLARSTHVTGIWIFYQERNFNSAREAGVEFVIGYSPTGHLVNFNHLSAKVSSVRFVGVGHDYRIPTFTLYQYTWYQGFEQYTEGNVASVNLSTSGSFIITGKSAWTIYDRPNYGGTAYCVYPPSSSEYVPGMVPDTAAASVHIPHNSIKSIRKGCVGKRVAGIRPRKVRLEAPPANNNGSNAGVSSVRPDTAASVTAE